MAANVSRRNFAKLFAVGGSAALLTDPIFAREMAAAGDILPAGPSAGEPFWKSVREQFVMPPDLAVMYAANLCRRRVRRRSRSAASRRAWTRIPRPRTAPA
jgi:hypothetical protein